MLQQVKADGIAIFAVNPDDGKLTKMVISLPACIRATLPLLLMESICSLRVATTTKFRYSRLIL
jgi:hypothetical protein